MTDEDTYWAHSPNGNGKWQTQNEHTYGVTQRAVDFAEPLGIAEEARLTAILHDLGKYSKRFQDRLKGLGSGLDHWSPGAWAAIKEFRSKAAALAIQGHHIGLQSGGSKSDFMQMDPTRISSPEIHPKGLSVTETDIALLLSRLATDGFDPKSPTDLLHTELSKCASMLDVRMLFSTLVDADFLDTESHFSRARKASPRLDAKAAFQLLDRYVTETAARSTASGEMKRIRKELWAVSTAAGYGPGGLWTLTAPTGAGKTLSMLGFALQHLMHNPRSHPRRIIVVLPFLSIIDQTAAIYREIFSKEFGEDFLIEHHSLAGTRAEPDQKSSSDIDGEPVGIGMARQRERELSENWDCPLVITTSVQFLESLFTNRPSAARKLHRLANSVILMDEVQTIPQSLALPTLATLSHLSARYGATVVFSTATQPAFTELDAKVRGLGVTGWQPTEIASEGNRLFESSRRVRVEWPDQGSKTSWEDIADQLAAESQSVCIVNLKRHAVDLAKQLSNVNCLTVRHLSTSMCPKHRRRVLEFTKPRLTRGSAERFCLISTQCIEAGVDGIDSPILYRAFGPFEAIAQAAGRCNRSGVYEVGRVVVFNPISSGRLYPGEEYQRAAQVTANLLAQIGPEHMDIYSPELFSRYYKQLYKLTDFDNLKPQLIEAIEGQNYSKVAELYRLIDNDSINVLVPYVDEEFGLDSYNRLVEEARESGLTARWIAKARPYTIGIFRPRDLTDPLYGNLESVYIANKPSTDWFIYMRLEDYDPIYGLAPTVSSGFWQA